jgi:fermentation-respiration switch protein FrsA (DUF1100 family)
MSRLLRTAGLLLAGLVTWWSLGAVVPGGAERFYLLAPPVCLGLVAARSGRGWRGLRPYLVAAVPLVSVLTPLTALYNLVLTAALFPETSGGWLRGLRVEEVGLAVYFVTGVICLGVLLRSVARPWLAALIARVLAFGASGSPQPPRPSFLRQLLAEGAVAGLFAPFLVATFHVHRFKVPNPERPAELAGRAFQDIQFETEDGYTLRGWFIPCRREPSDRTLVICHGMGANRSGFLGLLPVGETLRANVLLFDFRGHGASEGHTVTFGCREKLDVLAAVRYLRTEHPDQARAVVGLGVSMGAASLLRAAAEVEPPLEGVILDSSFAAADDLADTLLGGVPAPLRACLALPALSLASLETGCWLPGVRPIDQVHRLRAPLLLIHAAGDRLIPAEHSRRLHARAREPKALWVAGTGDHGSAFNARDEYLRHVAALLPALWKAK